MVCAHKKSTVFIYKLTVLLCHLKVFINKLLRRNSADAHYDFRLDNFKLLPKPIYAHILLFGFWVTVFRRAAFNHICNIYIFITRQVNACKEFIEQLTASANKRLPLQILVFTRALTYKHNIGILFADTEYKICSAFAQIAFCAIFTFYFKFI